MATSVLASQYSISQKPAVCSREAAQDAVSTGHHDLISFLGLMQKAGVDLLPIKWQPALENLGTGGSACISQALVNVRTNFAFKRLFFEGRNTETCFERLGKEALILRHVYLINHVHLIRLEAYCCEILKEPERISPVLIFEKFPLGNLQAFLLSEESRNITFSERLGFCADIADALAALHRLCWFDRIHDQSK
jgi:Protein tyrosine and serine/threonine kinase